MNFYVMGYAKDAAAMMADIRFYIQSGRFERRLGFTDVETEHVATVDPIMIIRVTMNDLDAGRTAMVDLRNEHFLVSQRDVPFVMEGQQ